MMPILTYALNGMTEAAEQFLNENPGAINKRAEYTNNTPLHLAVKGGYAKMVRMLIERGADLGAKGGAASDGIKRGTPLHFAVDRGNDEIARLLLENGADPNAGELHGETPLHTAISFIFEKERYRDYKKYVEGKFVPIQDKAAMLNLLFSFGANPNIKEEQFGKTALGLAVSSKFTPVWVLELLIANGADPNIRDYKGRTPMEAAKEYGFNQIVEWLENHG